MSGPRREKRPSPRPVLLEVRRAHPRSVGACLLTVINTHTVNAKYNVLIVPYMPHHLLDSFSKADGENSGVHLIWASNGYTISITI